MGVVDINGEIRHTCMSLYGLKVNLQNEQAFVHLI